MLASYSFVDLLFYLLLYSFVGWGFSVCYFALKDGKFVNRGLLNVPFAISEGITAVLLMLVLPTMEGHAVWQFVLTFLIVFVVDELALQFVKNISRRKAMSTGKAESVSMAVTLLMRTAEALLYLCMYLLVHPFVYIFVTWLPDWLVLTVVIVEGVLVVADFFGVRHTLRRGVKFRGKELPEDLTQGIGDRMAEAIWKRLEKAYPGVERAEPENYSKYTFAKGICFDKLVWVFLVSSFLGALIEMVFCRVTGGTWMNRSSVLYGSFSFVWGFGAVVLTVVLQRLAGKDDRHVFLAGFVVGGVYEYLCSVFTELVFGTVFWDYSWMPLNLGGRTNVLYCIFWGLLAVVWVKVLFPVMDKGIEKMPPLVGKILTWALIVVLLCDGGLTAVAMQRYTQRQTQPEAANVVQELLDSRYDDAWMESRWPNMKIPTD